ncbi:Major Facilitator Superfamily protein [compost metagenome]
MADGIRYVMVKKELLLLSLCFMFVGLGVGLISPLSIFLVTERLGLPVQYLQWITIPYGLGEVSGGIVTFGLAAKISPKHFLTAGLLVNGAGILLTGFSNALWLTMAAQFVVALLQPAIYIGNNALVMQHTEHAYIGRVTGMRTPFMTGSMLLMMSLSGLLKEALSISVVYRLAGLMILLLPSRLNKNKGASAY